MRVEEINQKMSITKAELNFIDFFIKVTYWVNETWRNLDPASCWMFSWNLLFFCLSSACYVFFPWCILEELSVDLVSWQLNVSKTKFTCEQNAFKARRRQKYRTTDPRMKQFLTLSMCGYLSGSVTLMSVSLMLRYWSTLCNVPVMLKKQSLRIWGLLNDCKQNLPQIVFELDSHILANQTFEERVEQL